MEGRTMSIRRQGRAVVAGMVGLALVSLTLHAQEPKDAPTKKDVPSASKKAFDPTRRVPPFFGQIGLTLEQRESVYKVQGKHMPRIEELQKEISRIRHEMLTECEGVLTDAQRKVLSERRLASEAKRKAAAAARAQAPKNAPTPTPVEKKAG